MPKRPPRTRKKTGTSAPSQLTDLRAINSLLAKFGGGPHENAIDAAQDIIYDAWDSSDKKRRIALAKKALELSPLCADGYVLLAQEAAKDANHAIELYRQGVEAGEKRLGRPLSAMMLDISGACSKPVPICALAKGWRRRFGTKVCETRP